MSKRDAPSTPEEAAKQQVRELLRKMHPDILEGSVRKLPEAHAKTRDEILLTIGNVARILNSLLDGVGPGGLPARFSKDWDNKKIDLLWVKKNDGGIYGFQLYKGYQLSTPAVFLSDCKAFLEKGTQPTVTQTQPPRRDHFSDLFNQGRNGRPSSGPTEEDIMGAYGSRRARQASGSWYDRPHGSTEEVRARAAAGEARRAQDQAQAHARAERERVAREEEMRQQAAARAADVLRRQQEAEARAEAARQHAERARILAEQKAQLVIEIHQAKEAIKTLLDDVRRFGINTVAIHRKFIPVDTNKAEDVQKNKEWAKLLKCMCSILGQSDMYPKSPWRFADSRSNFLQITETASLWRPEWRDGCLCIPTDLLTNKNEREVMSSLAGALERWRAAEQTQVGIKNMFTDSPMENILDYSRMFGISNVELRGFGLFSKRAAIQVLDGIVSNVMGRLFVSGPLKYPPGIKMVFEQSNSTSACLEYDNGVVQLHIKISQADIDRVTNEKYPFEQRFDDARVLADRVSRVIFT